MVGDDASIDASLAKARHAFQSQDVNQSIEQYTNMLDLPPPDEAIVAECLERLSFLHRRTGDNQKAVSYLFRLVNLGEAVLGANHDKVVKWREDLAAIYSDGGHHDQTAFVLQATNTNLPEDPQEQVLQTVLGEVLKDEGAFDLLLDPSEQVQALIDHSPDPFKTAEERGQWEGLPEQQQDQQQEEHQQDQPPDQEKQQEEKQGESTLKNLRGIRNTDTTLKGVDVTLLNQKLAQAQSRFNPTAYMDNILSVIVVSLALFFALELLVSTCAPLFLKEIVIGDSKPFSSSDQIKRFKYLSNKKAMLSVNLKEIELPYQAYQNNVFDWLVSLPSGLMRKEYWFQDRGQYLTDEQDTLYIDEQSPETTIIYGMKEVADACLRNYQEKGVYPAVLADLEGVKFEYLNPYTARTDMPLLQTKQMSSSPERPATITISKLIAQLKSGGRYLDEPSLYPGCVDAHHLTIRGLDGNKSVLVVHGCGADGKPLTAGEGADRTFVIAQIDGTPVDFSGDANPLKRTCFGLFTNYQFRSPTLCILKDPVVFSFPLYLIKYRGLLGFSILALLFLLLSLPLSESKPIKKFAAYTSLVYFALAILCIGNALLP